MMNLAEAYDFALFEEKEVKRQRTASLAGNNVKKRHAASSSVAPAKKHSKSKQKPKQKQNIVTLSKEDLEKSRRAKINPFKATVWTVCFCVIFGLVITMVYGQVQLTELTNEVNTEITALSEANSKEIYLNTKTLSQYDLSEVEAYASETLGMTKMNEGQITYVNLVQEDKGVVLQETDTSVLTTLLNTVKSWFA